MANPSSHQHPTRPPAGPADTAWQKWSRAWTRHLPLLTGRADLTVLVAPGAGGGAPACLYPRERRIEVDATHIGAPDIANLAGRAPDDDRPEVIAALSAAFGATVAALSLGQQR